jgi:hypothetical protein
MSPPFLVSAIFVLWATRRPPTDVRTRRAFDPWSRTDFQGFSLDRSASRSTPSGEMFSIPPREMVHGGPSIHPDLVP